jgi:DNA-binding MarR family transcriptional regulator
VDNQDLRRKTWKALCTFVLDVHDEQRGGAKASGLSPMRLQALYELSAGPLSLRELRERLSTDSPYVSVIVNDLARRRLVTSRRHSTDRRVKLVSLTTAGRAAAQEVAALRSSGPAQIDGLDTDELSALNRILSRLVAESRSSAVEDAGPLDC